MTNIDIDRCLTEDGEALFCASLSPEIKCSLKTSLNLEDRGKKGSKITWSSSDESAINSFGRVIRPKSGEAPKKVKLTAKLELNQKIKLCEFDFCVQPDEVFSDPGYISDEEFFGENGFLDFNIPGLADVRRFAQSHDFRSAKNEVYGYFKSHDRTPHLGGKKDSALIEMMTGGMQSLQRSDRYFRGKVSVASDSYVRKSVMINTDQITPGCTLSLAVVTRWRDSCGLKIAGAEFLDEAMRPKLLVRTDKGDFVVECEDSATLCPEKIIDGTEEMYVKTMGEYLGSDTYVSIMKFNLGIGVDNAVIKSIVLDISIKKDLALRGEKEAYILLFAQNTWVGKTARWQDFLWQFSNRAGVAEKDAFDVEEGFDFEYFFQRVRFMYFPWAVSEYLENGDENIPYALITTMCNFIEAKGNKRTYCKNWHIGMGWYNDSVNQSLCAGWPRALDAAGRLSAFTVCLPYLTQSGFMTPEILCCALKYIYDGICGIIRKSTTVPVSNLRMFELMGALRALSVYPEFTESKELFEEAVEIIKNLMMTVTFPDGTYMEATGGYSNGVCVDFVEFIKLCSENGIQLSDEFRERLKKFAIYNVLIQGPDGESIQYGDQSSQKNVGWQYPELMGIFGDDELDFILTRGDRGTKPSWTSFRFPDSSATVLRDSWSKTATYIWTQSRGGGSHGHQDDHHITLIAENRVLLTDAGIFTYSAEDPYRRWGISPKAHNTVIIDGHDMVRGNGEGTLEAFETSDEKDYLSQTSHSYPGFEFTRSITWLKKENVIYVEDTLCPDDPESINTFRQAWHLNPTAKISFDFENKAIMSGYDSGANIKITSLDPDVELKKEEGWYDYGYQQLSDNPFGWYVKEKRKGTVTFRTEIRLIR